MVLSDHLYHSLLLLLLRQGLSLNIELGQRLESSVFTLSQCWHYRCTWLHLDFYVNTRDFNSDPRAWVSITLTH